MVRSQLDIAAQLLPSKPWRSVSFLPPKFFLVKNSFDGKNYSGATDWQKSAILPLLSKQITQFTPTNKHTDMFLLLKLFYSTPCPRPRGTLDAYSTFEQNFVNTARNSPCFNFRISTFNFIENSLQTIAYLIFSPDICKLFKELN
ncbi:MAG: hypothetical protein H7069_03085 [Phormidesmis sp. FL-bin-119]|nr:hypothetical protein [Pedobacter sp.]